ncbi:MAG: hypothetical protein AAGF95_24935 [Chloroflexota bacterium]
MALLSTTMQVLQKYRRKIQAWLTLQGRIRATMVWTLALGPLALVIAIVIPYQILFYIAYVYLLLIIAGYIWVRIIGPRVTIQRKRHNEWAQVGDELVEQWEVTNQSRLPLI